MVSDDTTDSKYGRMSLAVGKDSGWYTVDMGTAEHYTWGKNEGCDIFSNSCPTANVSEFCATAGHWGCSDGNIYTTYCSQSTFTGSNCQINLSTKSCKVPHSSNTEAFVHGPNSVCLWMTVGIFIF
jgi:hypothetical protein